MLWDVTVSKECKMKTLQYLKQGQRFGSRSNGCSLSSVHGETKSYIGTSRFKSMSTDYIYSWSGGIRREKSCGREMRLR